MTETERKRQVEAQIWLGYFNRVLFEKGIITEAERNRLALKIESWRPSLRSK